jgi:hypothetical protein
MTSQAGLSRVEGGVSGTDCAKCAPGDAWGGISLEKQVTSASLPSAFGLLPFLFFNVSFAYFRLAVRLSLDKKLDR